jgi:hypothetical protein
MACFMIPLRRLIAISCAIANVQSIAGGNTRPHKCTRCAVPVPERKCWNGASCNHHNSTAVWSQFVILRCI